MWLVFFAQSVSDVSQSLREFGVAVTVLAIILGAFLWGVFKLREDNRADRDRLTRLIDDQRTSFLVVLKETQESERAEAKARREDLRAALAEQATAFRDVLSRLEAHWQRAVNEICQRLDSLTHEVQAMVKNEEKS